jgi:hypothetical protein
MYYDRRWKQEFFDKQIQTISPACTDLADILVALAAKSIVLGNHCNNDCNLSPEHGCVS